MAKKREPLMKKIKEIDEFIGNDSILISAEKRRQQENERNALLKSLKPIDEEMNRR